MRYQIIHEPAYRFPANNRKVWIVRDTQGVAADGVFFNKKRAELSCEYLNRAEDYQFAPGTIGASSNRPTKEN